MKLDRNKKGQKGRGKYALINLRTNKVEFGSCDPSEGTQFFVIKYSDQFSEPALRAYAEACMKESNQAHANGMPHKSEDLFEFAMEIQREADMARDWPNKKLPD